MVSDIYKIWEIKNRLRLKVEGKMVIRTEGNMDDLPIGGNASTEDPKGEGTESTVITGVDLVKNHHLQEVNFAKDQFARTI